MRFHFKASIIAVACIGLLLAGCTQGPSKEEVTANKSPLTADQLQDQIVGNTIYSTGYNSGTRWQWAGYYKPDGTAVGKAWWAGGQKTGTAEYDITQDDRWCTDWDNDWGDGDRTCWQVYKEGQRLQLVRDGSSEVKTFTLKEGNAHDL